MKNNFIPKVFIYVFLLFSSINFLFAQKLSGGSGTKEDPYKISTRADLEEMHEYVYYDNLTSFKGRYLVLTNDIDLGGSTTPFKPIGYGNGTFQGNFDGQGYAIKNMYIRMSGGECGLFYRLYGATISNLNLINVDITTGLSDYDFAGAIAGSIYMDVKISNCMSEGKVFGRLAGGLVGAIESGYSKIENSYSLATVEGNCAGGLIGSGSYRTIVVNCFFIGDITGKESAGGLISYYDGLFFVK